MLFQKDLDFIMNDIVLTVSVMGHTLENCTWVIHRHETIDKWEGLPSAGSGGKIFIMSTEFDKNISDWRYDSTDHKNEFYFFMRLVKRPKIAVKKCQNLIFKVNFQRQKSSESL